MGGGGAWRIASAFGLIAFLAGICLWQFIDPPAGGVIDSKDATVSRVGLTVLSEEESWIAAAQAALDGWAVYASTGDLAEVEGLIDPGGPQFAQLLGEASTIVNGGGSYSFVLDEPAASMRGGYPVVSAELAVLLDAEVIENLEWDIYLVEREGVWLLWTVEDR